MNHMAPSPDAARLAVVLPQRGPAGMYGPSCVAAALLAVDEINAEGGVLGRQLRPKFLDGAEPDDDVLSQLSQGIECGLVDGVAGWHMSSVRHAVARAVGGRVPYVYPTLYEGGDQRAGLLCVGETPDRQVLPALEWFRREAGVRRWFVAGADYVWPRATARYVGRAASAAGLRIVGTAFTPHGALSDPARHDELVRPLLDEIERGIERGGAEAVLMLFVGQDGAEFNREFAARGLDRAVLRFSPAMDETMLLASGPDATRGLCAASGYFASLATPEAMDFRDRYHARNGSSAPTLNLMAEATYDGIRMLALFAERGGGLDVASLERSFSDGVDYEGPRGLTRVAGRQVTQPMRLAIATGCDFSPLDEL
jgi:urea transport system substrate-binding protein